MFTGLIADMGRVADVQARGDGARLTVTSALARELGEGDSVAVDGVCLTAAVVRAGAFGADVVRETLARSALGGRRAGDAVNLELPLRASDRLGGHVVQGHVDGVGTVTGVFGDGLARTIGVGAEPGLLRYMVAKGSIAVQGVSLTVAAVDGDGFEVALIPETLERTTLGELGPGARVNLEVDVLAKYVEKLTAGLAASGASASEVGA
jgi:riboflavin synthase